MLMAPGSAAASTSEKPPGSWMDVECALYASNVVLGRCLDAEEASPDIQSLVECAVAVVLHPDFGDDLEAGSSKLAGTALTLLGGLPQWLADVADVAVLQQVRCAVVSIVVQWCQWW
jgi:hypothetical protein